MEKKNIKWYEHEETKCRIRPCMKPYNTIAISPSPLDGMTKDMADTFDAIVNVSATVHALFEPSRPDQRTYWYPLNELGEWSYAYFAYMFRVLDYHYDKGDKILVHCAAGAYRSPSIVRQWLRYRGHQIEEAYHIANGKVREWDDDHYKEYSLFQNYKLGNLPPNFDWFLMRLRHNRDKNYSYMDSIDGEAGMISTRPEVLARGSYFRYRVKSHFFPELNALQSYFREKKDYIKRTLKGEQQFRYSKGFYRTTKAISGLPLLVRRLKGDKVKYPHFKEI